MIDLMFYINLPCQGPEKKWVWNMQQHEKVENSSLLSVLVYPYDLIYEFWCYDSGQ